MTTIHTIGTLNWCQQFLYPLCANLLHAHVIVHDLMDDGFWNAEFVSYAAGRDLPITQYDPFYGFYVFIGIDGEWTVHSRCIFEATFWIHEFSYSFGDSVVRWSRVLANIIQLLANFDRIQSFSSEKLCDCSMLNVRHFSKMETHGSQNVIFSYEGNESIGPKLVYLNKNAPSIERQKPTVPVMYFEISCTSFPDNLYIMEDISICFGTNKNSVLSKMILSQKPSL